MKRAMSIEHTEQIVAVNMGGKCVKHGEVGARAPLSF